MSCTTRSTAGPPPPPGKSCGTTGGEITTLIRHGVALGRGGNLTQGGVAGGADLQFIWINGRVVGALAGLVICMVGQVAFGG